jgi:hypothetical protein
MGVGSALVKEMERIAGDRGLTHLELHASINAEPFYTALGYEALERKAEGPCSSLWSSDGSGEDAQESQVLSTARRLDVACGGIG